MAGLLRGRAGSGVMRRIGRPEAVVLAVILGGLAGVAWVSGPFWLSVAIGLQLVIAGLGSVLLLGPAGPGLGLARYAMPAVAAAAVSLAGRLLPGGVALLLVPGAMVLLWSVARLELRAAGGAPARLATDLLLVTVLFAAAAGLIHLFGAAEWAVATATVGVIAFILGMRAAEGRGLLGADALGQALLHALAVVQVGAAALLLALPALVTAAVMALAFHAWGGAAEALGAGEGGRSVAVEFGSLALLGLVVVVLTTLLVGVR